MNLIEDSAVIRGYVVFVEEQSFLYWRKPLARHPYRLVLDAHIS